MSIAERRVRKAIRKAQEALVAKGEPPTASAVARALARLRDPSSPALQLFRQQRRTTFNVAEHNRMLGEAHDDLEVLFEEFYAGIAADPLLRDTVVHGGKVAGRAVDGLRPPAGLHPPAVDG